MFLVMEIMAAIFLAWLIVGIALTVLGGVLKIGQIVRRYL